MRADLNAQGYKPKLVELPGIVQHSSASNEHYTPPAIVEACRATLGAIDLDPCSCALAQEVVQAGLWLGADALRVDWDISSLDVTSKHEPSRTFLNPPGGLINPATLEPAKPGTRGAKSSLAVYWCKLWNEWQEGNVSAACFVCFNLEVLRTTQDPELGCSPALDFPVCYFKERPRYWNAETPVELRGKHGQPSHPGAVVFLRSERGSLPEGQGYWPSELRFRELFSPLGHVVIPA